MPASASGDSEDCRSEAEGGATAEEKQRTSRLLGVHEIAERLQVPVTWVYEHTRAKCRDRLPGFRVGKYWRFLESDVAEWLLAKRRK